MDIARTIQPTFNLHRPFPGSCRNAWNLREGRIPMAEISLGAFRAFSFCLFALVDAHSECAWSAPQDRRPPRAGAHTPPRQPGRRASNPGTANLRISPRRTRQKTWRTPRAPAPHSLQPFFQTPRPPPCSREGAHVVPRSRSAPPLHLRGFPGRSLLPPPSALSGVENISCFGQLGPKLSKGDKVKGEEGGHKQIFFLSFFKGHCRFKSFFPGPPLSGSPYFGGAYLISATRLSSSLCRKIKARG